MIEKFRSYEERFLERLTRIQDPPPHPLQYRDRESRKMVKISVSVWSKEELREKLESLSKKGDWDKECKTCKYPEFLHKYQCLRSSTMEKGEEGWFADRAFHGQRPSNKSHGANRIYQICAPTSLRVVE